MNTLIKYIYENFFEIVLSIPNTIFFNFCVLPIKQAIKFPFFVSYYVRWKGLSKKNLIMNYDDIRPFSIRIGILSSDSGYRENKKSIITVSGTGKLILNGEIGLNQGIIIEANDGIIEFGNHFRCNYSCSISCIDSFIKFGDNVSLGWNVVIRNGDGHNVVENGIIKPRSAPIVIGNHCWICSHSTILKGVKIGNDCITAYKSVVTRSFNEDNLLLAGCPAKIVKYKVNWIK